MRRPSKQICFLTALIFLFNLVAPNISYACWWKGYMANHGSPEMSGSPSQQAGNKTGLKNQSFFAEPIYLHNGDFYFEFQDLNIASGGLPIEIKHTYKSQAILNNRFGVGWDLSYNQRIVPLANGNAYYFDGSNMRFTFSYLDGTNYVSPAQTYDKLSQNTDGTWTLAKKHGEKYYFNQNGLLTKIEDRNHNFLAFNYNPAGKLAISGIPYYPKDILPAARIIAYDWQLSKITDNRGREINLNYDSNGRLETIADFTGRVINYGYDSNGDLLTITKPARADFPLGVTTTFAYLGHKLISITDGKGQTYLRNYYNGQGMVDSQEYGADRVYLSYNLEDRETEVRDGKGFKTAYRFNENGNPLRKEEFTNWLRGAGEPLSYVTAYEYNNHSELIKITYPGGNSVLYAYDELGNLLEARRKPDPGSPDADIVTSFTYEPRFNFIKTTQDPNGNITTYYYDYEEAVLGDLNVDGVTDQDKGNLVKIIYPAIGAGAPEVKFTYNQYGQPLSLTDPNNNVNKYEYYSTSGYLSKVIRDYGGLNLATQMSYDDTGNLKTITDPKGNTTSFEYDSHNNLTKAISAAGFNYVTRYKYDANDNLIQLDRETGNLANPWATVYYTYDTLDKLETIKDELDNITAFGYDSNGNRTSIKDPEGNTTTYTYDERNLLWKVTDAQGNITQYSYDQNGSLKEIKDAKSNKTLYNYDGFDRLVKAAYPDNSYEEYSYDANSNLKSKRNPANQTITYTYDNLNRLTGKQADSQTTYTYDLGSRLTEVTGTTGAIEYAYDGLNRITQAAYLGARTISYEYDANSNRSKLTYPDATYLTYIYDQLNRLTSLRGGAAGADEAISTYTYDALSRRTQLDYANNTQASYEYDVANRLTRINGPEEISYTYDNVGNRLTMEARGLSPQGTVPETHAYTYDKTYQLTNADYPDNFAFSDTTFTYDALGNRTNLSLRGAAGDEAISYAANNLNQYTTKTISPEGGEGQGEEAVAYAYDLNGNLTSDGTNTYTYDYENRLSEGTVPEWGLSLSYTYDPFGRRASKTLSPQGGEGQGEGEISYLYDGDQLICEYDNSGNLIAKYIYGPGIDEPIAKMGTVPAGGLSTFYYHFDGLGSVTEITDSSGAVVETYTYDAFGRPAIKDASGNTLTASAVGNRFLFTGRELDTETGLYYYRARHYSPTLGRFLQRDPLTWAPNDIRILSSYSNIKNFSHYLNSLPLSLSTRKKVTMVDFLPLYIISTRDTNPFTKLATLYYPTITPERDTSTSERIYDLILKTSQFNTQLTHAYLYCFNDPINFIDPDGEYPVWIVITAATVLITYTIELIFGYPFGHYPPSGLRGGATATDLMYKVEQYNKELREPIFHIDSWSGWPKKGKK